MGYLPAAPRRLWVSRSQTSPQRWPDEVRDTVRAAAGGMLVGIPLMYTMEVWWIGSTARSSHVLTVLAALTVPVFLLNRTSGFRSTSDVTLKDALLDTVEAVAIAVICAAGLLLVLREVTVDTPLRAALGKIVYEAAPFSIGVALASHFLHDEADQNATGQLHESNAPGLLSPSVADIGATLFGAFVVAFAIAPTDEVPAIAMAVSERWLIVFIAVSLLVSYGIVFEAGFSSQGQRHEHSGIFQSPVSETVVSYLVSLLAAWAMLWYLDRIAPGTTWTITLTHVIILGLPASIGGAAGRLAV